MLIQTAVKASFPAPYVVHRLLSKPPISNPEFPKNPEFWNFILSAYACIRRNSVFSIFPVAFLGKAGKSTTLRGTL